MDQYFKLTVHSCLNLSERRTLSRPVFLHNRLASQNRKPTSAREQEEQRYVWLHLIISQVRLHFPREPFFNSTLRSNPYPYPFRRVMSCLCLLFQRPAKRFSGSHEPPRLWGGVLYRFVRWIFGHPTGQRPHVTGVDCHCTKKKKTTPLTEAFRTRLGPGSTWTWDRVVGTRSLVLILLDVRRLQITQMSGFSGA